MEEFRNLASSDGLLKASSRILELARTEDFARSLVDLITEIIPGCIVAFDECHSDSDYIRLTHNMPTDEAETQRVFSRLGEVYQQSPVYPYYLNGGKIPVIDIYSLTSRTAFKRTDLYQDIFKPRSITDQICVTLERAKQTSTLTINRDARISAQTVAFLKAITPQLQTALAISRELQELRARCGVACSPQIALTPREKEVFHWMHDGKRNREIALILNRSERTIEKHVESILRKTGTETRTGAISNGLNLSGGST